MNIQAVLFDADGVIQQPTAARRSAWINLLGRSEDLDGFLQDVFKAELPCLASQSDFSSAFAEVICRWNCSGSIDEALRAWTMIEPKNEIIEMIKILRQTGTTCCLATNQEPIRADFMSRRLGYETLFDREFYSCRMGVAKPNVEYFRRIVTELGIESQRVLFFDDREDNVEAARAAGLRAAHFHLSHGEARLRELLREFALECD
jgi:putative hydrolase of the HAD superfamily